MRPLFVAGNWKMNLDGQRSLALARALRAEFGDLKEVRLAVCPPFPYLKVVADALTGSAIAVGGQNMYAAGEGAYTGEVAGAMLLDVGCRYVILGHSERRHVIGEGDAFINSKVRKALELGLDPIVCVGEKLDERDAGRTNTVVAAQLRAALDGVSADQMAAVTIAYEPVWAIGTGRNATPDQAQEVHAMLRDLLGTLYDRDVAARTVIQYGGSVNPGNAGQLMAMEDVDGALVGGASLKADVFGAIIRAACATRK